LTTLNSSTSPVAASPIASAAATSDTDNAISGTPTAASIDQAYSLTVPTLWCVTSRTSLRLHRHEQQRYLHDVITQRKGMHIVRRLGHIGCADVGCIAVASRCDTRRIDRSSPSRRVWNCSNRRSEPHRSSRLW
jgi:hypothetical protein